MGEEKYARMSSYDKIRAEIDGQPVIDNSDDSSKADISVEKAFNDGKWMTSQGARIVRILCEFVQVRERLQQQRILGSVLVFGSARLKSPLQWEAKHAGVTRQRAAALLSGENVSGYDRELQLLKKQEPLKDITQEIEIFSRLVTAWTNTAECRSGMKRLFDNMRGSWIAAEGDDGSWILDPSTPSPLVICTGGGPGVMQAANSGAASVPGGRSMGMGVSLPFECGLNPHVPEELAFQFHYFFTRKFWMAYIALGVVVAPGGFGTMDELMEVLTLKQTGKMRKDTPVIVFGSKYWKSIINFEALSDYGVVSQEDIDAIIFADKADEAFAHIRKSILGYVAELGCKTSLAK